MFMAGLDTVAAQLTYSFWHLATHEADRRRLVSEPELIPTAMEEFLRYYAFVTPGLKVVKDTEIAGCRCRPEAWCTCRWHRRTATHAEFETPTR